MTDHLFFEPVDVWLFRDGRPFTAGSDHTAHSLFPPYPSVIQGAIRSHQLILQKIDLNDKAAIIEAVGTTEDYKNLRLRGPYVAKKHGNTITRFLPLPADAISVSRPELEAKFGAVKIADSDVDKIIKTVTAPKALPKHVWGSNDGLGVLALSNHLMKPGSKHLWLDEQSLDKYFAGSVVKATLETDLFVREVRPGIGQDPQTHTTVEGALYEVEFIRPQKNIGLVVGMDGYNWGEHTSGVIKLGGRHKAAFFSHYDNIEPQTAGELSGGFKVFFATPTYFEDGWKPDNWSKFFSGRVELIGAAISRFEAIGGFDYSSNFHKPSRRFVPAGSVYYFKTLEGPVKLTSENNAITDYGAEIGFGQIIIRNM